MKLGNRTWNLSWKLQTQLFIVPHLSWVGNILDVMQWTDAKTYLWTFHREPRQRRHPQQLRTSREGWFQSVTNCVSSLAPTTNPAQVWLVCLMSLSASLQRMGSSFCCQCPLCWVLLWAWDCFSIHPDMTLSLQKKPNFCHSIRLLSEHRLFPVS